MKFDFQPPLPLQELGHAHTPHEPYEKAQDALSRLSYEGLHGSPVKPPLLRCDRPQPQAGHHPLSRLLPVALIAHPSCPLASESGSCLFHLTPLVPGFQLFQGIREAWGITERTEHLLLDMRALGPTGPAGPCSHLHAQGAQPTPREHALRRCTSKPRKPESKLLRGMPTCPALIASPKWASLQDD